MKTMDFHKSSVGVSELLSAVGFKSSEQLFFVGSYSPDSQGSSVSDFAAVDLLSLLRGGILFESIYRGTFTC